jgi:hypothetical protein
VQGSRTPSREAMEAVVAAIFEIVYLQARRRRPQIAAMLGQIVHVWLTPFFGVEQADAFLDAQLPRRQRSAQRA